MNEEEASSVQVQEMIDCSDPLKTDCWSAGWPSFCPANSGTMVDGKIDVTSA